MIRGRAVPGIVNYQWILGKYGRINAGYTSSSKTLLGTTWENPNDTIVTDTLWLIVRNPLTGCSDTSWKTLRIYPKPHAGIVEFDSLCASGNILASFDGDSIPPSIRDYRWMWKNNPNTLGQIVQPNDSSTLIRFQKVNGQFVSRHDLQLVVTTAFGCMDTIEKAIFLKPLPVIKLSDTLPSLCDLQVIFLWIL
jgi:hypothetical protein